MVMGTRGGDSAAPDAKGTRTFDQLVRFGEPEKQLNRLEFALPEIELEILGEVLPRELRRPPERPRESLDDLLDVALSRNLCGLQRLINQLRINIRVTARRPDGEYERQPRC